MSIRFAKQVIYAGFYIVIVFLVVWDAYSFMTRPVPSCFDNIQNQGEQGVDCGGPCAAICSGTIQPISVVSVNAFTASAGNDTFLAKIANPNSADAAASFDYSFNVYDSSGTLLGSYPGQSFMYGQEIKYLVLANEAIPSGVANADLTIKNVNWVAAATLGAVPQLTVQNISVQFAGSKTSAAPTVVASGQIANNDVVAFNHVLVVAIYKDANGNPVGASQTVLDSISPTQIENFLISYPAVAGIDPDTTEVEAYALRQ